MILRESELLDACFRLAHDSMLAFKPVSTDAIMDLARELEKVAMRHVEFVSECKRDPNIVVRAIWWLTETQATTTADKMKEWLEDMLEALLELAVPKETLSDKSIGLLKDMEFGFREFRGEVGVL